MVQTTFDSLQLLCRATESLEGRAELCQDSTGLRCIRLSIQSPALQKAILLRLSQDTPVRMTGRVLELLLPWQDGESFSQWRCAVHPNLGQRRDQCLSLLAGLIGSSLPPDLVVLSAQMENLRISTGQCVLLAYPDLARWHYPFHPEQAVQAAASLMYEMLTQGFSKWERFRFPEELQLVLLRCSQRDYTCWESLQQDLAALPDDLNPIGWRLRSIRSRLQAVADRYGFSAARILVCVLILAALLSLASAVRVWYHTKGMLWPGMTTVGSQILHREEDISP